MYGMNGRERGELMYNLQKIKRIKAEADAEVQKVLDKYNPLINEAIRAQVPKSMNLYCRMGSTFLENQKKENIENDFSDYIHDLQYGRDGVADLSVKEIFNH